MRGADGRSDWIRFRTRSRDVVLIAGKGHEDYQEIGGVKHPFSDRERARAALEARRAS